MKTVSLRQNTPEWHAHRANHFNASDAPAMMGESSYKNRDKLLYELFTGIVQEPDAQTQKRFDDGHKFEALARPLAEKILGEELSPTVGVEGKYSASFDGITFNDDVIYEHKTLNSTLRDLMVSGEEAPSIVLPIIYPIQMEHQLLVSKSKKVLFIASEWKKENHPTEHFVLVDHEGKLSASGTPEYYSLVDMRYSFYEPNLELREKIIAGWAQFEIDLANYVPPVSQAMPQAEVIMSLPSLVINARAEITTTNMAEYGEALKNRLQEVRNIVLITDQDFSNAKAQAKHLRESFKQAKQALEAMTAQNTSFDEAKRMVESWMEDMRLTALKLENDIDEEDKKKKGLMVALAQDKYQKHLEDLREGTHPIYIPNAKPDFAGAIKGKKNYDSMQSAVNDLLAKAKADANQIDMDIRAKQTWMKQFDEYSNLFPDMQAIIFKATDDFKLLVESRIATQKSKDLAAKEKAEAEARAKVEAEQRAKEAEQRAKQVNEAKPQVSESEAVTLSSQHQVDEPQSSLTLSNVKNQIADMFAEPSADDIITVIANHYVVSHDVAKNWLYKHFYAKAA